MKLLPCADEKKTYVQPSTNRHMKDYIYGLFFTIETLFIIYISICLYYA